MVQSVLTPAQCDTSPISSPRCSSDQPIIFQVQQFCTDSSSLLISNSISSPSSTTFSILPDSLPSVILRHQPSWGRAFRSLLVSVACVAVYFLLLFVYRPDPDPGFAPINEREDPTVSPPLSQLVGSFAECGNSILALRPLRSLSIPVGAVKIFYVPNHHKAPLPPDESPRPKTSYKTLGESIPSPSHP